MIEDHCDCFSINSGFPEQCIDQHYQFIDTDLIGNEEISNWLFDNQDPLNDSISTLAATAGIIRSR